MSQASATRAIGSGRGMTPDRAKQLQALHVQLIKLTQAWALRQKVDLARAADLRRQAALLLHTHYRESIPVYARLAEQAGIDGLDDVEPIKQHLMFPDDLFKSYDQRWLDEKAFGRMNAWLSEISSQPVQAEVDGVESIDAWIDRLAATGLRLVYSSGTSGSFSLVPRGQASWRRFRIASTCYLTPWMSHKAGAAWARRLIGPACRLLPPETFARLSRRIGVKDYDAIFLDFSSGRTGNQTLAQELAPLFRRHYFLYETDLSPAVLRLAFRGPRTAEDGAQLARLQELVADRNGDLYRRATDRIRQSTADGQSLFIFGTTHQYKELCDYLAARGECLALPPDSLVLFGGGWKSFKGERIAREPLLQLMSERLGLPPERILEGYSMTEISVFMLRCDHGRFHIPPLVEPVVFDEELRPLTGCDLKGTFGFIDPLATDYPGFLISGDEVHLVEGDCACGLAGPALTSIGRARAREIKGCGGIMASLAA